MERGQQVFQPRVSPALISAQLYLSQKCYKQKQVGMRRGRHGRRSTGGQSGSPAHCMLLLTPRLLLHVAAHICFGGGQGRAAGCSPRAFRAVQGGTWVYALKPAAIKA